ncbi:MAG: preprotein translocase subunit SecG [Granulosicoccaceae bacterium]|jgi:preprotein translocase subunit SecG
MEKVLLVIHVFIAGGLIGLILIQHGKGADAGAAFGSGASSTVFGSRGSASFLTRLTGILATLFFISSFVLGALTLQASKDTGADVVTEAPVAVTDVPETPAGDDDVPVVPGTPTEPAAAPTADPDVPKIPE